MANKKISELPTKNTPAASDFMPIVDTSGQIYVTKKATLASIIAALEVVVSSDLNAYLARDGAQTAGGTFTFSNSVTFSGTVGGSALSAYVTGRRLDEFAAPTNSVGMNNQRLTNLAAPTAPTDAATKSYVDAARAGLDVKDSVRVATAENITLSGLQTIDGVLLQAGDRVLVKNQISAANNGLYAAAVGTWSRTTDANSSANVTAGLFVFVEEGNENADSGWVLSTNQTITLGTTPLSFAQFSGAGQITAGAGLTKTGNTIDIETASANRIVINSNNIDLAATGVTAGVYGGITVDAYGRVTTATNNLFGNSAVGYVVRVGADGQPVSAETISSTNLPTTGVSAGTYISVTVDIYGRVTAATNNIFSNAESGYVVSVGNNGQLTAATTISSTNLPLSGVTAGTYNNVTVDTYGRVTAATNNLFGVESLGYVVRVGANGQPIASPTVAATNLPTTGIATGTYTRLTVDAYGRATAGSNPVVIASNKTLTVNNTMTLTAADSANVNFGAGGNVMYSNSIIDGGSY